VIYKEYNKSAAAPGPVLFANTTGRFFNITNKPEIIKQHDSSRINLTTYLMGKGRLDLGVNFALSGTYGYDYKGHLGPMNLQDGNSVVMPLGLVKFVSGDVKSLDFKIRSTPKTSIGKITFLYSDLKVALLKHDPQNGYTKKPLVTLFANLIVLKTDNPDNGNSTPRSADVAYVRPLSVPFFGSMWSALLSGIKPCAGLGKSQKEAPGAEMSQKDQKAQAKAMKKADKKAQKEQKKLKKEMESKKS
jgi:hypothetical protein